MAKTLKTAQQAAANWLSGMQNVTAKVTQGVQAVQTAPGQAAAAAQSSYLQGVNANVGKWAQNVAAVPLSTWQQAMITKGAPRMASGAQAAQGKYTAAAQTNQSRIAAAIASLPPRGPKGSNNARSAGFADAMHAAASGS